MSNDADDGRGAVWIADDALTARIGVALAELGRARSRGATITPDVARVVEALHRAGREIDDVIRHLRVSAGERRGAN
jgi:hypothetical protein